jgi:hypothetical protein
LKVLLSEQSGNPANVSLYLQTRFKGSVHTFAIDKGQVAALADRISLLIGELKAADFRFENIIAVNLEVPVFPEFQVGVIGIVWLGDTEQVALELQEIRRG